jgi:hypothetical protein|tara:strand:+ start:652 stop:846 length:195 start_codon:yes stop_codon:yes gene_type:complete
LGPSIYRRDAETVSGFDVKELATVKKLGLVATDALDTAIDKVIATIGKSERSKYRAVVYYVLAV